MTGVVMAVGDFMIYYCGFVALLFVVGYTVLAKWWVSDFGRHLFFFMLVIALIFVYIIVVRVFGKFGGWEWFRLILMIALGGVLTWRVWILVTVQIKNRSERVVRER